MGKLKKGCQNGNHAKAPQTATTPAAAAAPAVTNALSSAPLAPVPIATTTSASSTPPQVDGGNGSKPASLASLGRPPPGVGSRSIRSASSASVDTTSSLSLSHSPPALSTLNSADPSTTSTTTSVQGQSHLPSPAATPTTSALALLRSRLQTDEARRSSTADSTATEEATGTAGKKLQKKRPSVGPDVFVQPPVETTSADTETTKDAEKKKKEETETMTNDEETRRPESDDSVSSSSTSTPSPSSSSSSTPTPSSPPSKTRHVHYADLPPPSTPAPSWLSYALSSLPLPFSLPPSHPDPHSDDYHASTIETPEKVHGRVWEATEMVLGLSLAGVLVMAVGAEIVVERFLGERKERRKMVEGA